MNETIEYLGHIWTVMTLKQFVELNAARNWEPALGARFVSVADLEWDFSSN